MRRCYVAIAGLLLLPAAAVADGAGSGCGGDAYSLGEVVPATRGGQEGPIMVVPYTLCADLASGQGARIDSLSIYLDRRREGTVQQPEAHPPRRPAVVRPRY